MKYPVVLEIFEYFLTDLYLVKDQVNAVLKIYNFQLRNIGQIHQYLFEEAATNLVHAFISSRLDYMVIISCLALGTLKLKNYKKFKTLLPACLHSYQI